MSARQKRKITSPNRSCRVPSGGSRRRIGVPIEWSDSFEFDGDRQERRVFVGASKPGFDSSDNIGIILISNLDNTRFPNIHRASVKFPADSMRQQTTATVQVIDSLLPILARDGDFHGILSVNENG